MNWQPSRTLAHADLAAPAYWWWIFVLAWLVALLNWLLLLFTLLSFVIIDRIWWWLLFPTGQPFPARYSRPTR